MRQHEEVLFLSECEAVNSVVYVLAKLDYPRHQIAEVMKELKNTFGLNGWSSADRKNLLPTIVNGEVKKCRKGRN